MSVPAYPSYKDSGAKWIGKIPDYWSVRKLKFSAHLVTEKAMKKSNPVALENIESWSGRYLPTETEFEGDGVSFRPNDILFGKLRPYLAKALLATEYGEAVGDFHVLRPTDELLPKFLHYQVLENKFIDIVDGSTFGSKMPRASWEHVGAMPLPLPPMVEQISITEFLEQETAKIDALIHEQKELIALLSEKRKSVISNATTLGVKQNVQLKATDDPWLPHVPSHWRFANFQRFVSIAEGQVNPEVEPYRSMTLIAPNHVESGTGRLLAMETAVDQSAESGKYLCRNGDVIYSKIRPALRKVVLAPEDCLCSADMYPMNGGADIDNEFLAFFMLSEAFSAFAVIESDRVAMPKINRESLKAIKLPVPPWTEQQEIVSFIKTELKKIDDLASEATLGIQLLRERRSSIISAAVTGKIDVRGQHV